MNLEKISIPDCILDDPVKKIIRKNIILSYSLFA